VTVDGVWRARTRNFGSSARSSMRTGTAATAPRGHRISPWAPRDVAVGTLRYRRGHPRPKLAARPLAVRPPPPTLTR
jgi:hypothetical protein